MPNAIICESSEVNFCFFRQYFSWCFISNTVLLSRCLQKRTQKSEITTFLRKNTSEFRIIAEKDDKILKTFILTDIAILTLIEYFSYIDSNATLNCVFLSSNKFIFTPNRRSRTVLGADSFVLRQLWHGWVIPQDELQFILFVVNTMIKY